MIRRLATRRLAKPLGALVALAAVASLSSCSTFDRRDVAAEVNGQQLTLAQLDELAGGVSDAAALRQTLAQWIQIAAAADDPVDITSSEGIQTEGGKLIAALLERVGGPGRERYEQGLDGAEYLCLAAITLDANTDGEAVLAELAAGRSFADVAEEYSTNPDYASSGGVIYDANGQNCHTPADFAQIFSLIIEPLVAAQPEVGEPVLIEYGDATPKAGAILLLRPFDELSVDEQANIEHTALAEELHAIYEAADVYVNPRLGQWDSSSASVVAG